MLAALVGCGRGGQQTDAQAVAPPPVVEESLAVLEVEVAGCTGGERAAMTCVIGRPSPISIWVAGATTAVIAVDGSPQTPTSTEAIDGGWRSVITIPEGATSLEITREGATPWTLRLLNPPATPTLDRIVKALPNQNDPKRAPALRTALVEMDRLMPTMTPYERFETLRLATVLAWDSGGDPVAYGRKALAAALELDDATVIVRCANLLVHMLAEDAAEADLVLDLESLYAANVLDAGVRAEERDGVGAHAIQLEDTSEGLAALEQSESLARRVGLRGAELGTLSYRVGYLGIYGLEAQRSAASERLLRLLDRPGPSPCQDALALSNVGASISFAPRAGTSVEQDEAPLRRALSLLEGKDGCSIGDNADLQLLHAKTRIAYVDSAIARRDWDGVATRLKWFDNRSIPVLARPAVGVARAELALARSDFGHARRVLAEVPAKTVGDLLLDWRAAVARGRLERATDHEDAAIAAFLSAEAILDGMMDDVGADQGREAIGVGLYAGATGAIELLVEAGRSADAAIVARRSRARTLRPVGRAARIADLDPEKRREWSDAISRYRSLRDRLASDLTRAWSLPSDERAEMQKSHVALRTQMREQHNRAFEVLATRESSAEALAQPGDGELWLIFHPAAEGWVAIATSSEATRVVPIGTLPLVDDMPALATTLLGPFEREIGEARTIKFLGMGAMLDLPFHELPFGSGVLIDHAPVLWSLDAGTRPRGAAIQRALVVADPATRSEGVGSLPRSRAEGDAVAEALRGGGIQVDSLVGDDATAAAVLEQLERADWFHYAGHGLARGSTGWDSAMPLAGEAELGVRDVLAAAVPRTVVLSGCSTAAVAPGTVAGGVSLATAFILAGSESVIGSTREVQDDDAADMAATLYRAFTADAVAKRFQTAILDGRGRARGWTRDLRLWVP